LFLVAHFHNMLIPGLLYGMLAGYHYWFPKAFGFRLNEKWGRISFACWVVGFYIAFMPLYVLGAAGVARRTQGMFDPIFRPWFYLAGVGALILLAALGALFFQLWVSIRERDANGVFAGDPWDGRGLEWSTSAPPPEYNYACIPRVHGRDPFFDAKRRDDPYAPPASYDAIELPKSSMTGPMIGVVGAATAFGLVWHMWWLTIIGVLAIIATVIARSFARHVHQIFPPDEVKRTERRWLRAVAEATPTSREVEMTSVNQGLAEVSS
jgi:cytochrome o ubiquinol oxidase subunit 1